MSSLIEDYNKNPAFHQKSGNFNSINEDYARYFGKNWLPQNVTGIKQNEIKDLPFMITADGTIVCVPKLPEMGLMVAVGMTGYGKTLISGYMLDNIFYNWNDNIAVLNDSQEETWSWSEPNDKPEFSFKLKVLNQEPMPLPMIYIFPNSEIFKQKEPILKNKNCLVISIPFEEVITNIEKYIPDLGGSEKYLTEKKEQLLKVKSEEELFEIIESIDNPHTKGMETVKRKLDSCFKNLIAENILNISDVAVPSYLIVKEEKLEVYNGNPFTAIMKADCIPSFITSDLYTQKHKDAIFSYHLTNLFQESLNGAMKGKRTWLYFDELTRVVHADIRYSSPETEKALNNIASRGRNNGISLMYATQRYNEIPKGIRTQTKYAIIFRHKSEEESKMIRNDFGLDKGLSSEILRLKKYEAIAATTEYFVCYKGEKKWEEPGPLRGTILPPLHKNRFLNNLDVKGGVN